MRGMRFSTLLFAVMLLGAPTGARALTYNVSGGSVDLAQLCADVLCMTETMTFVSGGAASGSITVGGGTVDLDVDISVISFSGNDGGVTGLELQTLNYVANGLAISGTPTDFTAVGTASVGGTKSETPGGSAPYSDASVAVNVDCQETSPGVLKCGVVVAGVTMNLTVGGNARFLPHSLDLTSVPEPGTSVMALTAGLLGLLYVRRNGTN